MHSEQLSKAQDYRAAIIVVHAWLSMQAIPAAGFSLEQASGPDQGFSQTCHCHADGMLMTATRVRLTARLTPTGVAASCSQCLIYLNITDTKSGCMQGLPTQG